MNYLQSIKAVSLISILSVSCTLPMARVGETIKREVRRAHWNFEAVKEALPNHTGAYVAGALALTGLGALIYNRYNAVNASPNNNFASPADSITSEAISYIQPAGMASQQADGEDSFIIGHRQKVSSTSDQTETPLHQAVREGDINTVTQILSGLTTGAQRHKVIHQNKDRDGRSVMQLANELNKFAILSLLAVEMRKRDQ